MSVLETVLDMVVENVLVTVVEMVVVKVDEDVVLNVVLRVVLTVVVRVVVRVDVIVEKSMLKRLADRFTEVPGIEILNWRSVTFLDIYLTPCIYVLYASEAPYEYTGAYNLA